MRQRCYNPKNPKYHYYGGRGIQACDRWGEFELFLEDMGERPGLEYSIDRIDNDGNYEPENCRWATRSKQSQNKRKKKGCSSQYRGVCWFKRASKWIVHIKQYGKRKHLGYFIDEIEAARAYDTAALELFGDKAKLNFPDTPMGGG